MNSSKTFAMITIIALMMLFVYPTQSMPTDDRADKLPTRQKRWTFNTWRLHGRRQLPNELYRSTTLLLPSDVGYQYPIYNDEDDIARKIHEQISQLFPEVNRV